MFLKSLAIAYLTAPSASGARPSAFAEQMSTTTRNSAVASHPERILQNQEQYDAERKILDELHNSCGGVNWYEGDNSEDHCAWKYVTCNDDRTIRVLYLYQQEMTGTIPESIGNLLGLESLWLYNNGLTGTIPDSIGSLKDLKILRLYNNELSGSIPESIGNLKDLEELRLSYNKLTGTIPENIGSLASLEKLWLNNNELTGTIPESIGSLINLQSLWLYNNGLTGTIPDSIGSLASLEGLYLDNNALTGTIPESIMKLNLNDFEYSGNSFTETTSDTTRNPKILGISAPVAIGTGIGVLLIAAFAAIYFKNAQERNTPSEDPQTPEEVSEPEDPQIPEPTEYSV